MTSADFNGDDHEIQTNIAKKASSRAVMPSSGAMLHRPKHTRRIGTVGVIVPPMLIDKAAQERCR